MLEKTLQEVTEQDLVASLQQGRPEGLALLYDKYAPVLLGLLTRMMQNQEKAEAVLQDTFVTIWDQRAVYDPARLRLLSWLITVARDTALAALKSDKYKDLPTNGKLKITPEEEKQIKEMFSRLEQQEKAALDLIYLQGYSCAEAAAALSVPVDTLKIMLKMACKNLRGGSAA